MKSIPKALKIFFLSVFILQMIGLAILLMMPKASQAASTNNTIQFTPQITIPDGTTNPTFKAGTSTPIKTTSIAQYINAVYRYAIGIVGILATVVLMFGGFLYLMAGGDSGKISEAKEWIYASLTGLVIALCAYMILNTINPKLTQLGEIYATPVNTMGCCYSATGIADCQSSLEADCKSPKKYDSKKCSQISACGETTTAFATKTNTPTCTDITAPGTCYDTSGCAWNEGSCIKNYTTGNYCCLQNNACDCFTSNSSACGSGYSAYANKQCATNGGDCGKFCK